MFKSFFIIRKDIVLQNIRIIQAEKSHIISMAKLIAKYLSTCNIQSSDEDILSRNIAELNDTFHFYQIAIDEKGCLIGLCGIGKPQNNNDYGLNIGTHRDVLYVVVDKPFQRQGIGTKLLKNCLKNIHDYPVLYEAWGEIKNGDVNSHQMLAKCSFDLLADLGTSFYKNHGYCAYCVNKDNNCHACYCKIYIYKRFNV